MWENETIEPEWLSRHLSDPNIVILDGTFTLPGVWPDASELYRTGHIPGAIFFDIDAVADQSINLPHMLPSQRQFESMAGAMGISEHSRIVVYDRVGLMSAGRVWWTFRAFGHSNVSILNGGFQSWAKLGYPVEKGIAVRKSTSYSAVIANASLRCKKELLKNIESNAEQVIDARSSARFHAIEKEVRPGVRSGHIPGSINLPYNLLTDSVSGRILPVSELHTLFLQAGLDLSRPVIATCGSGVTACALVFALHVLGKEDVSLYDGAWAEWGLDSECPILP